jgi:hypothetical protein
VCDSSCCSKRDSIRENHKFTVSLHFPFIRPPHTLSKIYRICDRAQYNLRPFRVFIVATAFPHNPADIPVVLATPLLALGLFSHCMGGVQAPRARTMAAGTNGYENNRPSKFARARLAACLQPIATTSMCPCRRCSWRSSSIS